MTAEVSLSRRDIDAVIFDLDGVITQTATVHEMAWKEIFDEFLRQRAVGGEFKPFTNADYLKYVDGKPRTEGIRSFLASRNIELAFGSVADTSKSDTVCGLGNRKNEIFHIKLKELGPGVYPSSMTLLRRLRRKGFLIAVVSSSKNCERVLDAVDLTQDFDTRVDGNDITALDLKGKPHPDLFLEAARRLDKDPARCAVLEDAVAGVAAGHRGHFGLVIGVDRQDHAAALQKGGADVVINDLAEIKIVVHINDLSPALPALDAIDRFIGTRKLVFFLDYDGTLTPIVAHPEEAVLADEMRHTLETLAASHTVAVISGRGLQDVRQLVGLEGLYYAGSHGFEISGPHNLAMEHEEAKQSLPDLDSAEQELTPALNKIEGSQLERKRFSIAVHYRNVPPDKAGAVETIVDEVLSRHPHLRKGRGKKVYELQPDVPWNKGRALMWLLEHLDLDHSEIVPLYIGDDLTDEDAFRSLGDRGLSVVVGDSSRETAADYRLQDPAQVEQFLHVLQRSAQHSRRWRLSYEGYRPEEEGLREALCTVGNGYFATRGAAPESRADEIHYPGTYLAGGYNRLKTALQDRTIENEDLVNIPNWLCLDIRFAEEPWFNCDQTEILFYQQDLLLREGVLQRMLRFRDAKGRETEMIQRRLVSMAHRHLATVETVITALNWSGTISVRSALDGQVTNSDVARYRALNNHHLEPVETRQIDPHTILLKVRTNQSQLTIAQVARLDAFLDHEPVNVTRGTEHETASIAQTLCVNVAAHTPLTIEKTVALYTGRDAGISECGLDAVTAVTNAPRFKGLLQKHAITWQHLWEAFDIQVQSENGGDNQDIQQVLRLYKFHLLQSASMHSIDIDVGMPSRGWHGEAYRGHIFWDELIIFPFLNYRVPAITRTLLMYRYRRIEAARRAARALGYRGAMYPWQSGSNGREETQQIHLNPRSGRWINDHSHLQRHINAAIAYNVWQYFEVSGDRDFLTYYGAEMILEIARFFSSLASYNEEIDRFEIRGVMGPDEFHEAYPDTDVPGINNNAYTNLMVVTILNKALALSDILSELRYRQLCERLAIEPAERDRWEEITRKMRICFHDNGIISQFEGYENLKELDWEAYRRKYGDIQRLDRILEAEGDTANRYKVSKQADVLMLFYLFSAEELSALFGQLGYPFDPEQIPRNIDYYLARTSNGSSLSRIIHSWVAMRRDRERSWDLFREALKTDIADLQGGTTAEGIHLGAMAGCVDLVQRCYTGLESSGGLMRLNPSFPRELQELSLQLRYRGHLFNVIISCHQITISCVATSLLPVTIEIRGQRFSLEKAESKTITFQET